MTKIVDVVKELRGKLMGYEMELNILEADYIEITRELRQLSELESTLIYNINFLKNEAKIAVASEFNKSIKQLKEVRKRMSKYIGLKSQISSKMREVGKNYDYYRDQFDKAFDQLENEKVILVFDPSKRKRKKDGNKKEDGEREDL